MQSEICDQHLQTVVLGADYVEAGMLLIGTFNHETLCLNRCLNTRQTLSPTEDLSFSTTASAQETACQPREFHES